MAGVNGVWWAWWMSFFGGWVRGTNPTWTTIIYITRKALRARRPPPRQTASVVTSDSVYGSPPKSLISGPIADIS